MWLGEHFLLVGEGGWRYILDEWDWMDSFYGWVGVYFGWLRVGGHFCGWVRVGGNNWRNIGVTGDGHSF